MRLGAGAGTQIKVKVASGLDLGGMQDGGQRKGREGFPLPPFSDFSSHKKKKMHICQGLSREISESNSSLKAKISFENLTLPAFLQVQTIFKLF